MHNRQYCHKYPNTSRQKALGYVFDMLEFSDCDQELAKIMYDSYLINMGKLMKYAHSRKIDELDYILSIRNVLLESKNVRSV